MISEATTFLTENPSIAIVSFLLFFLATFQLLIVPYLVSRRPYEGIPTCPKAHWLLGHLHMTHRQDTFPDSYLFVYRDHADQHGRTGYWMGNKPCISTLNIPDARYLLTAEQERARVPIISHYIGKVIGQKNLLFLNGKEWKTNRAAVTRTFVHSFLVQSQHDVYQVAQDLVRTVSQKVDQTPVLELDMMPILKMVTSDVIGKAAFATDFDCCKTLTNSPIIGAFEYIMNDMTLRTQNPLVPWNYCFWLPLEKNRKLEEQIAILRNFIESLLQQARQNLKLRATGPSSPKSTTEFPPTSNPPKISLMDRLVEANDSAETVSSDQVLIDVVSTLLIASYDTTSTALAFALYLLAMNPDIQEECFQEVQSVLKENGAELSNPDPLVYCNAVVQESLRLYPPAAVTGRTLTKPIKLPSDGFVIPKGAHCVVPIFAIHRLEQYFPKPLECRPDRWCQFDTTTHQWIPRDYQKEQQNAFDKSTIPAGNPEALIPFSAGGRSCPGGKFAVQEATIILANVVQAFRVLPVPDYKLKLGLRGPLPFPEKGMPLRFEKR